MDFELVKGTKDVYRNIRDFGTYKIEVMKLHQGYEDRHRNGPWRWCAYIHFKPEHFFFSKLSQVKNSYDGLINIFPFHGGCTFFKIIESGDIKIGCDFQHYGDEDCGLSDYEDMPKVVYGVQALEKFMENFVPIQ